MQSLFSFNIHWKCLLYFFLLNDGLKVSADVTKVLHRERNYVKKIYIFFHVSVKDLVNFSKNSKDTELI